MAAAANATASWAQDYDPGYAEDPAAVRVAVIALLGAVFVVAFLGNAASCVVIAGNRAMHSEVNLYLLNLAASDTCLLAWIFVDMRMVWNPTQYPLGHIGCKIHFFIVVFLFSNGVLTVTALAIERYQAVCRPFSLRARGKGRVLAIVLGIWAVSAISATFDAIQLGLKTDKKLTVCLHLPSLSLRVTNCAISILMYVGPVLTTIVVYTKIARKLNEKAPSTDVVFNGQASKRKATRMLVILTALMFLCWTPFLTVRLFCLVKDTKFYAKPEYTTALKVVLYLWVVSCWLSTAVNPLVFSIMSAKFRENFMALLMKKKRMKEMSRYVHKSTSLL